MEIYSTNEAARFTQTDLGCDIVISTWQPPAPNAGDVARIMTHWHTAPEGETEEDRAAFEAARNAVAAERAATYLDAAGKLARTYDPEADDHLRIYGVAGMPPELIGRYFAHRPPTEFDWGTLDPDKENVIALVPEGEEEIPGDIPQKVYSVGGVVIARRLFEFSYSHDLLGATELTLAITPEWARNDGQWVAGVTRSKVVKADQYNDWRDSARDRIFKLLKTYLPRVLTALEVVADVPAGEALTGLWLATNHASPWNLYMATGRKEAITATLTADTTEWLDSEIPEGVIDVPANTTVRAMILGALR